MSSGGWGGGLGGGATGVGRQDGVVTGVEAQVGGATGVGRQVGVVTGVEGQGEGARQDGVVTGVEGQGGVATGVGGQGTVLNPYRSRGFGSAARRIETPSLNDMRAKQNAIVAKFMTFFQRKCSLVIEMYEGSFYRQKPNWDRIAEFIYNDLCNTPELRQSVQDVQFHPVKMLLFIRFNDEQLRDDTVTRLQSSVGVTWTEYRVRVKGYSLDAQVKFIRLLGVSPETGEEEIKRTFVDVGIGEVMEIKKGLLDAGRLPGVTNGTWTLRVKIFDPDTIIPSYIHRRDEGELWSLNFEGRVFCCWKCGSGNHIGDKCRDQTRTFDEIFSGVNDNERDFVKPTWAAVVRSGQGDSEEQRNRVKEMERMLKENNQRKDKEKREFEEQKMKEDAEVERLRQEKIVERQRVFEEATAKAKQARDEEEVVASQANVTRKLVTVETLKEGEGGDLLSVEDCSDADLLLAAEKGEQRTGVAGVHVSQTPDPVSEAGQRARLTVKQHVAWLEQRRVAGLVGEQVTFSVHPDLERIFGPGATRLAIDFQASAPVEHPVEVESEQMEEDQFEFSDDIEGSEGDDKRDETDRQHEFKASTPKQQRARGKKRFMSEGRDSSGSNPSVDSESDSDFKAGDVVDLMNLGSSFITSGSDDNCTLAMGPMGNENKKLRLDDQEQVVEGLGGGLLDDPGGQQEVLQVQGGDQDILPGANLGCDMAAGKVDNSSEEDDLSSGDTGDILPPGSSRGEGNGGV